MTCSSSYYILSPYLQLQPEQLSHRSFTLVSIPISIFFVACCFIVFVISTCAADSGAFDLKFVRFLCEILILLGVFLSLSSILIVCNFNFAWFLSAVHQLLYEVFIFYLSFTICIPFWYCCNLLSLSHSPAWGHGSLAIFRSHMLFKVRASCCLKFVVLIRWGIVSLILVVGWG